MCSMSNVQELLLPHTCRIFVAGDNHGNPDLLQNVLNKSEYNKNDDFLVLLGDVIEKGPDHLGALKLSYQLCRSNPKACFVLGNVDRWCRRLFCGNAADALSYSEFRPDNILTQAARRYGLGALTAENYPELCAKFHEEFGELCEWYFSRSFAAQSEELIFVHSGIGSGKTGYLDDVKLLTSNYDYHRTRVNNSGKWVICGHIPCYNLPQTGASHCPIADGKNRIVFTDGGTIIPTGQQNLTVITKTGGDCQFGFSFEDRFPKMTVVSPSNGTREGVIRTVWDDCEYEPVSTGRYFSRVRLCKSGQCGLAKNEMLVRDTCRCELNAFVKTSVGEKVGVVRSDLSGFAYIKSADGQLGFIPRRCLGI